MSPDERRAIQMAAAHAAPPTSAPTAPPVAVPAPNPATGLYGSPPPGHPMSAAPAAPVPVAGAPAQGSRPGRPGMSPGTARALGGPKGSTVTFVQPGAASQVPGAPEVRTRGAGRLVSGPPTGASVTAETNATRRGGAVPVAQSAGVTMQGHAPMPVMAPAVAAAQWNGGQVIPQSSPTAATTQIADLTVMLSQHTRPGFLERQLRTLQSSSVRAAAMAAFVNPAGVQIQDALLGNIPKIRADRDMGPWMRWRFATEIGTRYTLMLDDDCIFGTTWLQRALDRMLFSEQQGQQIVVAAGGIVYRSDQWADTFPIGPEAPPDQEQQVDIGRGAWLFPTELLEIFFDFPRLPSKVLTIPTHFAAAMQREGIPTITLAYPLDDRAAWGMSTPPSAEGSMSKMLDALAAAQRGNSAHWHREEAYNAYRAAGWKPLCVLSAEAETMRVPMTVASGELGAPPPVVAPPGPSPTATTPAT